MRRSSSVCAVDERTSTISGAAPSSIWRRSSATLMRAMSSAA
jgi:hypothetical protein